MTSITAEIAKFIREQFSSSKDNIYIMDDIAALVSGTPRNCLKTVASGVQRRLKGIRIVDVRYGYFVVSYNDVYIICKSLSRRMYILNGFANKEDLESILLLIEEENKVVSEADTDEE